MKNYDFLLKFVNLQKDLMFNEVITFKNVKIALSQEDSSEGWNLCLIENPISDLEIKDIEYLMKSYKRIPAIYFENSKRFENFSLHLIQIGYSKAKIFKESWMFYSQKNKNLQNINFDCVTEVKDNEGFEIFIETLLNCRQENDPQNPYGKVEKEYILANKKIWNRYKKTKEIEHFIIYKNNKPVAVSTLTSKNGLGYISDVSSLKSVRGQGYGKLATLYCVKKSILNANTYHFLITKANSYPNEFYKRIGFKTKFVCSEYSNGA